MAAGVIWWLWGEGESFYAWSRQVCEALCQPVLIVCQAAQPALAGIWSVPPRQLDTQPEPNLRQQTVVQFRQDIRDISDTAAACAGSPSQHWTLP